ncbi:hypothetical protein F5887DRAFT_919257 [Amanita rubescens]|nr:hypothetical protein F5887DRAFT_919257 [Amanita rubescens]
MLTRNALFLSILFVSASAAHIAPLLAIRQTSACQSQCSQVLNEVQSGTCDVQCICTASVISAIGQCVQCAESQGITIPGVGPNYVQTLETDCTDAGYPVSGVSTGGSGSWFNNRIWPLRNWLGKWSKFDCWDRNRHGRPCGSTATSSGSGSGITFGKSSATGLTAQLGAVAAAVAGVIILAA